MSGAWGHVEKLYPPAKEMSEGVKSWYNDVTFTHYLQLSRARIRFDALDYMKVTELKDVAKAIQRIITSSKIRKRCTISNQANKEWFIMNIPRFLFDAARSDFDRMMEIVSQLDMPASKSSNVGR